MQDKSSITGAFQDHDSDYRAFAQLVLEANALDRSEKVAGVAQWFLQLLRSFREESNGVILIRDGNIRANLVWRAVATAPAGFCHVRSSMIGTLLDDVKAGLPFDQIARRWKDKTHPLQYQRPTALSDGNVEQANKIVEQLGSQGSLARRFARLEDVLCWTWQPPAPPEGKGGPVKPFDVLKTKQLPAALELPAKRLTWEKFRPLLAAAICPSPAHWEGEDRCHNQAPMAMFVLDGAKDLHYTKGALFFPETLRGEYREVRKAMEAYSQRSTVEGRLEGTANGIAVQKGGTAELTVRVRSGGGWATYIIDRWE